MKYGLIGERLGHSFSKKIHEQLGYEYLLCEIAPDRLQSFMTERAFSGINVTIPYKRAVMPYLDLIDKAAEEIGAVNTVVNRDGRLYGYNTDYFGMLALIKRLGVEVSGRKAAILGTGGTSRTAEAVLRDLGASSIIKVSREAKEGAVSYEELYDSHSDIEILINTTPVGMYPDIQGTPVDIRGFKGLAAVIDAVYNPIRTNLIQDAQSLGISAAGGLYMLIAQAVKAAELFLPMEGLSDGDTVERLYSKTKGERENILLIGMPASGKSTVGRMIAKKLDKRFVDTDELIEERVGMRISEFFATYGEAEFRKVESSVIKELATETSLVIATGGGVILDADNLRALRYLGKLYFIDRPLEALIPTEDRPLSRDREAMRKRYEERYSLYLASCDERIDATGNAEAVAEKILERYR